MNVSIEALKTNQDKYIFCRIEVDVRPVFYFAEQKRPHRTHRWLNTEQWAIYDRKLKELLLENKLDNPHKTLTYKLNGSLRLQIQNSQISKKYLYNTLNNKDINLVDIINVVDCKIDYQDDVNTNGCSLSTPIKIEVDEGTPILGGTSISEKNEDIVMVSCRNSSLISSSTQMTTKDIEILPALENIDSLTIKVENSDDIENQSPIFPYTNVSTDSPYKQSNEASSDSADIAERILSMNVKLGNNNCADDKPARLDNDGAVDIFTKKNASKNLNENEKSDLDIEPSPPEKRKRKLYASNDDIKTEKHKDKESTSRRHKLLRTDKSDTHDVDEKKPSQMESSHTARSSSSAKKKRSHRERSKSPCLQEQRTMDKWLCKKGSKDDDKTSKSSKHTSSKHSSSSSTHNGKSSSQKQHNSPHKKPKPLEPFSPHDEEEVERIKQNKLHAETECKLFENIKELMPTEPQKVCMLDLMKMPADELLSTYEKHRPELESIFNTQKSKKRFTCLDGVDHYLVINLVANKVQQKLMAKLGEFEKSDVGTPKYGDLFSMVLMPEWILRVFMAKFKMSRSEAIGHIKAQNNYNALQAFPCDKLVQMASKKK